MRRMWESLLVRKNGGRPANRANQRRGTYQRRLGVMELEPRRVLSADFALGADGLVIDGFDSSTDALSVAQVGDRYEFTLATGDWTNVGGNASGVAVQGQTLAIDIATLAPLAGGVSIVATPGSDLDVTLGNADFSGLAGQVSIVGAASIDQVDGTSITSAATAPLALTSSASGMILGDLSVDGLFLSVIGPITDAPGSQILIDGNLTIVSRPGTPSAATTLAADANSSGTVDKRDIKVVAAGFGSSSPDVNGDAIVNAADLVLVRDFATAAATTTGDAGIFLADNSDDELIVTGTATFIAQSEDAVDRFNIEIGVASGTSVDSGAQVEFGELSLFGGAATVVEDNTDGSSALATPDGTVLNDSDVTTLNLLSAGAITDTGTTDVSVADAASFNAINDDAITLDDIHDFGTLAFNGGAVTIVEQSGTQLANLASLGFSEAESLALSSAGAITDSPGDNGTTILLVENNASFTSTTGDDITLDDTYDFGSLTFSGGAVTIDESTSIVLLSSTFNQADDVAASVAPTGTGTVLSGDSLAFSLNLTSDGPITDDGSNTLTVIANARFDTIFDDAITLDDFVYNFGSLTFDGGAVTIDEASATILAGSSNAGVSLDLDSVGAITDLDGSALLVENGIARFNSVEDESITLDGLNNFAFLSFDGGAVTVVEASSTVFGGPNAAETLFIDSAGSISDASLAGLSLDVTGNARFDAADGINIGIGSGNYNFGSLTFSGGLVRIEEESGTELSGVNDAVSLSLESGGALTDAPGTVLDVSLDVFFSAAVDVPGSFPIGAPITLDGEHRFGALHFSGSEVAITEADDTTLVFASNAESLDLVSAGTITDGVFGPLVGLVVEGNASFTSLAGEAITLDEGLDFAFVDFGSLTFNGGDVRIVESFDILLSDESLAFSLELESFGNITDDGAATVTVLSNARFETDQDITLSDPSVFNFGTLTFAGDLVSISEDSSTRLLGDSTAFTLLLDSFGGLTDSLGASLNVLSTTGLIDNGGGDILLDETVNFGTLFFSAENVEIFEDSATQLIFGSQAASLVLDALGPITADFAADLTVDGNARFDANGNDITLLDSNTLNFGSLTFDGAAVTIVEDSPTELTGVSNALTLSLSADGPITDDGAASVNVAGIAAFDANGNAIRLSESSAFNFGSLSFQGTVVEIFEDSSTELAGDNAATVSLALTSQGDITDAPGASLDVAGLAELNADLGGAITLDDTVNLGSLTFSGGAVGIFENSDSVLVGDSAADSLVLDALGSIQNIPGSSLEIAGNARFDANGDFINLGGGVNFGSLTFDGSTVDIAEASSTLLSGDSIAQSLSLITAGDLADEDTATLQVTNPGPGGVQLTAAGSIVLADAATAANLLFIDGAVTFNLGGSNLNIGTIAGSSTPADAQAIIAGPITINGPNAGPGGIALDPFIPPAPLTAPATVADHQEKDAAFADLAEDELAVEDKVDLLTEDISAA